MDYKKTIKILLPSNNLINVQINGNEEQVKEIVSKISNISPEQIKGIKDSKGNYYTLSSFLKNNNHNINTEIYYELILSKNINENNINNKTKDFQINKDNENINNNFFGKIAFHKKAISMDEISLNDIKKFSSHLLNLLNSKEINESQYFLLNKMINNKNQELITQFKFFQNGKITHENFIFLLKIIYDNKSKNENELKNPNEKINDSYIKEIKEKMKDFFSPYDNKILNTIINQEKSLIEIQKVKLGGNLSTLIKYFQKEINKNKKIKNPESSTVLYQKFNLNQEENKNKLKRMYSSPENNTADDIMDISKNDKKFNKIKKLLNECYQNLIQFFFDNEKNEYNNMKKIYSEEKKNKKKLKKSLNNFCNDFIHKKIKIYLNKKNIDFSESKFRLLNECIELNNNSIINAFQNLLKSKSIKSLIKELISVINYLSLNEKKDNKENKNKLIEIFINDLNQLNLETSEIEQIKEMIKIKNEEILSIIDNYENKNINEVSEDIIELLKQKSLKIYKLKVKDPKMNINCPKITERKKFIDIDYNESKLLEEFKKITTKNFTKEESSFLLEKYKEKNPILISTFDIYLKEWNTNKLINSLNLFIKNELISYESPINRKNNKQYNSTSFSIITKNMKTPEAVKATKDKLSLFINPTSNRTQNIIIKQKEIISILFQEECIDKITYDIISSKIEGDTECLISAFEVYAVTKDHNEFIETLNIIAQSFQNYKISFYHLINSSKFSNSQKDELIILYKKKDQKLFTILNDYENNGNENYYLDLMKDLIE